MNKFIVIEGTSGSGKTTQVELLKKRYPNALFVTEPDNTITGKRIREILLSDDDITMDAASKMLLFSVARSQLLEKTILPALLKGKMVICDQFLFSDLIFQGIEKGMGIKTDKLGFLDFPPNLTIFLHSKGEEIPSDKIQNLTKGNIAIIETKENILDTTELIISEIEREKKNEKRKK